MTTIEVAGIAAVTYASVVAAHLALPETASFAGFLFVALTSAAALTLYLRRESAPVRAPRRGASGFRHQPPRPAPGQTGEEVPGRSMFVAAKASPSEPSTESHNLEGRTPESRNLLSLRASLAQLEAELHALTDHYRTDFASSRSETARRLLLWSPASSRGDSE